MLDALHVHFVYLYISDDVSDMLAGCMVCSKDKPIPKPFEQLKVSGKNQPTILRIEYRCGSTICMRW